MNTSFTPGPWEVFEHSWSDSSVYGGVDNSVCICRLSIYDEATEETQGPLEAMMNANARLIAASPRMYEALVKMEKTFNISKIDPMSAFVAIEQARAAINLATGQEP